MSNSEIGGPLEHSMEPKGSAVPRLRTTGVNKGSVPIWRFNPDYTSVEIADIGNTVGTSQFFSKKKRKLFFIPSMAKVQLRVNILAFIIMQSRRRRKEEALDIELTDNLKCEDLKCKNGNIAMGLFKKMNTKKSSVISGYIKKSSK